MRAPARLLFEGPALAGCRELVDRLGWTESCGHIRSSGRPAPEQWTARQPRPVEWRGRQILPDIAYRGPLWRPWLGSLQWREYDSPPWRDFIGLLRGSLRSLDACVFVADSQRQRLEANISQLQRLHAELGHVGRDPRSVPVVFALNKRDLDGADLLARPELEAALSWPRCAHVETSARTGLGVQDAIAQTLALLGEPVQP